MNKRRVGTFLIPYKVFNAIFAERYSDEALREFMDQVLIVRAEAVFVFDAIDAIEYQGYSELFDEVSEGEIPPEYKPLFIHMQDDTVQFGGVKRL